MDDGCAHRTVETVSNVLISLNVRIPGAPQDVFEALCDWEGHGNWIPFTRVEVESPTRFVAYTGLRPLVLEDRMEVEARDDSARHVRVVKLGPVLRGVVDFRVEADGESGSTLLWEERLDVPYVPAVVSPVLAAVGGVLFRLSFRRFSRQFQ